MGRWIPPRTLDRSGAECDKTRGSVCGPRADRPLAYLARPRCPAARHSEETHPMSKHALFAIIASLFALTMVACGDKEEDDTAADTAGE